MLSNGILSLGTAVLAGFDQSLILAQRCLFLPGVQEGRYHFPS
jgi:hypothetical protein